MPGSSVSVADYLAIDIACRHFSTQIPRLSVANYFHITVNALNARLRTCADRLKPFPNLVDVGVQTIRAAERARTLTVRPALDAETAARLGKSSPPQMFMHPIWLLSRHLLELVDTDKLNDAIVGLDEGQGQLVQWLSGLNVHARQLLADDADIPPELNIQIDKYERRYIDIVPTTRPEDAEESSIDIALGRKRRHDGSATNPALRPPTEEEIELGMPILGPEKLSAALLLANTLPTGTERKFRREEDRATTRPTTTDTTETVLRGARTEPFSPHDLLVIYISRKIRFLDWDAISWALSRYKTPVVSCLSEAKITYEPHHEKILETMRLCCWPENSMYLISIAAHEILGCMERGAWAEELEGFKQGKGLLYTMHMQRKVERMVRRATENPEARVVRRRRERMLGYTGLGIADYGELPGRKRRLGACGAAAIITPAVAGGSDGLPKLRKRRTRAQIEEQEAEKKRAREVLKAAGLKTNGEPTAKKKVKEDAASRPAPPVTSAALSSSPVSVAAYPAPATEEKRRKYDLTPKDAAILEQALKDAGAGSPLHDLFRARQRNSYDVKSDRTEPKINRAALVNLMDQQARQSTPSMAISNDQLAGFDTKLNNLQQQLPFGIYKTPKKENDLPVPDSDEDRVKKGMSMSFLMN